MIRAVVVDAAARTPEVDRLLAALGLEVVPGDPHGVSVDVPSVGIFGRDHPLVEHCYAWYVGSGPCPGWMRPARHRGALVLTLLGTGLAQERAGAAFRAASGSACPAATVDTLGLLDGITRAVRPVRGGPEVAVPTWQRDQLLSSAFDALDRCCRPNGAIAAAPARRSDTEPDYGFFWQRDAAAAASALHGLALHGPPGLRDRAAARLSAYVAFVADLGGRSDLVAAGRCTLSGQPLGGYGDPQHDGPAGTALVLLAVVEDPVAALRLAGPFLEHLLLLGVGGTGYDLWELVQGRTFHAANLRRRALQRAADVALRVGDPRAVVFRSAAGRLTRHLQGFLHPSRPGYVHCLGAEPPWFLALSRLDMSIVGSELLSASPGPGLAGVGATLGLLEDRYADRWPVNLAWRRTGRRAVALGRFPEDCNDGLGSSGGNPWPVTTLWAAQWHLLHGAPELGKDYLELVLAYGAAASEQIDGLTGQPRGAVGLAWSAAELVTTLLLVS